MPQHPPQHRPFGVAGIATHTRSANNILQATSSTRSKRPFEPSARDFDPIQHKKAKLTVEILSRHPAVKPAKPPHSPNATSQLPPTTAAAPRPNRSIAPAPTPLDQPPAVTKHREKVINGIKHELDRLQPSSADTKEQGRKLRSQEATRFKSDLSAYFPDYDEIIGNDPKEERKEPLRRPGHTRISNRC